MVTKFKRHTGYSSYAAWPKDHSLHSKTEQSPSVIVNQVSRSDTVRNAVDQTGWRPPSQYHSSGFSQTGWFGQSSRSTRSYDPIDVWEMRGALDAPHFIMPPLYRTGSVPSWLVDRTVNRALIDLKDSTVNYAQMLAESAKAASMVASNAKILIAAFRYACKGNMRAAANELGLDRRSFRNTFTLKRKRNGSYDRRASSRWLELQYGWMPLLSDIHGVIEDFEKGFLREPRFAVTKESRDTSTESNVVTSDAGNKYNRHTVIRKDTIENICRVRLDFVLDAPTLRTISQKGFLNPTLLAWELLPYSFVVDWFSPIGEFLETLDSTSGLTFKGGSITTFQKIRSVSTSIPRPTASGDTCVGGFQGYGESHRMDRRVLTEPPSGSLYLKNPFSVSHALNALALLRVAFK